MARSGVTTRAVTALALWACLATGAADELPAPALEGVEPAVAERVRELRTRAAGPGELDDAAHALRLAELGAMYHSLDFLDAALACYREAEALTPGDGRWPYLQGVLHTDAGDVPAARLALLRAMAVESSLNTGWARLGRLALDAGEPGDALLHFRRALAALPESAAAHAGAGQALLALDRPREAVEYLERALAIEPRANRLHYPLAMAFRALGEQAQMQSHLDRVGSVGVTVDDPIREFALDRPAGARQPIQQGNQAYRAGDYESAVRYFRQAADAAPEHATAWINLGVSQAALGRDGDARESLRRALEIAPDNPTALENLVALMLETEEQAPALSLLDDRLPEASDNRTLLATRARLRREQGRPAAAAADYRRLVELERSDAGAWQGLILATIESGGQASVDGLLADAREALGDITTFERDLVDALVAAGPSEKATVALARRVAERLYRESPGAEGALRIVRTRLLGAQDCTAAVNWLNERIASKESGDALRADLRDLRQRLGAMPRCGGTPSDDPNG